MPRLVGMMLVRNEAGRYLRSVLEQFAACCDEIAVLDDASTDATPDLCAEFGADVYRRAESGFGEEWRARAQLWEHVALRSPDWVLCLDADETLEPGGARVLPRVLDDAEAAGARSVAFRLYDMWSPTHYRADRLWSAHTRWWPLCVRFEPQSHWEWPHRRQHVGRFPRNLPQAPWAAVDLRVQHWGWARAEDRAAKVARYRALDPDGTQGGVLAQYASILDPDPNLEPWEERG